MVSMVVHSPKSITLAYWHARLISVVEGISMVSKVLGSPEVDGISILACGINGRPERYLSGKQSGLDLYR